MKRKIQVTGFMLKFLIPYFSFLIFFLSCQTMPNVPNVYLEDAAHAPLDTNASIYLFADVKKSRDIINLLPIDELKDSQVRLMLDRTDYIAAALFPGNSGRRFQLTAWGRYPGAADMAFSSNKNWLKHSDGKWGAYWHSSSDKLSLAVSAKNAFASSWLNNSPASPFAQMPGVEIPEGFNEFSKAKKDRQGKNIFPKAPVSCWLDEPGSAIIRVLNEAGLPIRIPVQKIFINIYDGLHSENQYTARILFQFENASQARATAALISIAYGLLSGAPNFINSIFLTNPLTQEGRNLEFISAPLNREILIQLFNLFS